MPIDQVEEYERLGGAPPERMPGPQALHVLQQKASSSGNSSFKFSSPSKQQGSGNGGGNGGGTGGGGSRQQQQQQQLVRPDAYHDGDDEYHPPTPSMPKSSGSGVSAPLASQLPPQGPAFMVAASVESLGSMMPGVKPAPFRSVRPSNAEAT
jgi:hypothetical protein